MGIRQRIAAARKRSGVDAALACATQLALAQRRVALIERARVAAYSAAIDQLCGGAGSEWSRDVHREAELAADPGVAAAHAATE